MQYNPVGRIEELLRHCLYSDDELADPGTPPEDAVRVEGIVSKYGLHPGRVAEKREVILALIRDIVPDEFLVTKGTGMHHTMEALLCLGMAIGKAGYCLPREMWAVLPGSMPYVWFDTEGACN
jgi:hypothetical protein